MILVLGFIVALLFAYFLMDVKKPNKFPPGPNWLPIMGCLPELKQTARKLKGQHLAFNHMSQVHNTNMLGLKLGDNLVVVVSSYPLIKQVLREEEYQSRPDSFFIRLRSMGTRKGITCTDGEHWNTQRNFLIRHLRNLGFGKQTMDAMIHDELQEILSILETENRLQMGQILAPAVINVLWALTAGKRIPRTDKRLQKLLKLLAVRSTVFDMSGGILTQFPWLRFLFPEKTGYNVIVRLNKELKEFFMSVINEHYENWTEGCEDDVIYSFITKMKEGKDATFTYDQLVMVCLDIFIAGAQTTSNTIDFAVLMMILHPDVQLKVQKCLDNAFGKDKLPNYHSRHLVPYVEAVLCETQRYCHVAPITGPRRVTKDTVLDGYRIPKNTTILMNNYGLNNDHEIWGDPETFKPERFLNELGELIVKEEFIPFNLGKRRCLGESLARNCIFTFFSGIFMTYDVTVKPDIKSLTGKPIPGITLTPESYIPTFTKR